MIQEMLVKMASSKGEVFNGTELLLRPLSLKTSVRWSRMLNICSRILCFMSQSAAMWRCFLGWTNINMGESSKFPKSWTSENQNLKIVCLQIVKTSKYNGQTSLDKLNQKSNYYLQNSAFWDGLSSQPQNSEFRNNPENFHPCTKQRMKCLLKDTIQCLQWGFNWEPLNHKWHTLPLSH